MRQRLNFISILIFSTTGLAAFGAQGPSSFSPPPGKIVEIAHSPEWLRLLHYRKKILRALRSEVDQPDFFLSVKGVRDSQAELLADLEAFLSPDAATARHGTLKQPVACAFPARLAYLKRVLGKTFSDRLPSVSCPEFEEWSRGISARSVSVVFSSAYPNNPASMFGHTFLRLDRMSAAEAMSTGTLNGLSRSSDFLSYGANFSASVPAHENPVKYALWGLFGGYRGRYDLTPYYRKVAEYGLSESRDLWEYRLSFTEVETQFFIQHLWELYSDGFFRYYFLDENCSYQILTALEAVRPDWKVSSGFMLSVLPVETVKHLNDTAGAVLDSTRRPSLRNRLEAAIASLPDGESMRLRRIYQGEKLSLGESTELLDTLILALTYEKETEKHTVERSEFMREVLLFRSRRGGAVAVNPRTVEILHQNDLRPDDSHPSSRFSVRFGTGEGRRFTQLSISAFEHDFLDRPNSFNQFSEVRLFRLGMQEERGDLRIDEVNLIEMASFAADSWFAPQKSWRVSTRWVRPKDFAADTAGVWQVSGGYGVGTSFIDRSQLLYAMPTATLEVGGRSFRHDYRVGLGAETGLILNPGHGAIFSTFRLFALWDSFHATDYFGRRWRGGAEWVQNIPLSKSIDLRLRLTREVRTDRSTPFENRGSLEANLRF